MLFDVRIQRPIFALSLCLRTKLNLSTSSCSASKVCIDEDFNGFLPWLRHKSGTEISSVLSIGKSIYGRSLFASKSIQAGDCILKVPYSVQLAPDNLLPPIIPLLGDDVGNVTKLALVMLVHQKLGQDSEWAPYISCLPHAGEMHSTIFWSDEELKMIMMSSLYQETVKHKIHIENEFSAIKQALDRFPELFAGITLEKFKHAYNLVESRAWVSTRGVSMIPFADFLNHDGFSETDVLSDETKEVSEVIADQSYSPGDEVLIRYGKFSNATLLLDFGFALPCNKYDQVQFEVTIPCSDRLIEMKLELLDRHIVRTLKNDKDFSSSKNCFILKEVKSAASNGRGIPQSLRALARVLCCTSPEELHDLASEAVQNDGRLARRPLKNKLIELQAHQFLLSKINQMSEEYSSFIKSLRPPSSPWSEKSTLRMQFAEYLLSGELRVLRSASLWLKNYCATLIDS